MRVTPGCHWGQDVRGGARGGVLWASVLPPRGAAFSQPGGWTEDAGFGRGRARWPSPEPQGDPRARPTPDLRNGGYCV